MLSINIDPLTTKTSRSPTKNEYICLAIFRLSFCFNKCLAFVIEDLKEYFCTKFQAQFREHQHHSTFFVKSV